MPFSYRPASYYDFGFRFVVYDLFRQLIRSKGQLIHYFALRLRLILSFLYRLAADGMGDVSLYCTSALITTMPIPPYCGYFGQQKKCAEINEALIALRLRLTMIQISERYDAEQGA